MRMDTYGMISLDHCVQQQSLVIQRVFTLKQTAL